MLPDGGTISRFQKENETYEELLKFIERAKQIIKLYKGEDEPVPTKATTEAETSTNETTTASLTTEELWALILP